MSPQDADIEIVISDDGLLATVSKFTAETGNGGYFSASALREAFSRAGIKAAPDPSFLTTITNAITDADSIVGMVVARGKAPTPAVDATIKPLGDFSRPVFPNDSFCEIIQGKPASDGITVTGKAIKCPGDQQGKSIAFPESPNCYIDTKTLQVRSETYGLVVFERQSLFIRPMLQVTKSDMHVQATLFPTDFKGREITPQRMEEALRSLNITAPIDRFAFDKAMKTAREGSPDSPTAVIARGLEPLDGKNGWFELKVKDDRSNVGVEDEEGNIDFRARGIIRSVPSDAIIGKLHAPSRGIPGRDVYGKVIPAHDGAVFRINLGENVEATETGSEFKSLIAGMVFFIQNTLSVTEVFMTRGDVNMSTGNLLLEKGSVHVRGAVISGFTIECPRNVLVDDVIESATITAGGDVEVKGGIIMDKGGRIITKGGVSAMFAKGATIEAQGDVNIAHEMSNCIIFAGQNVVATKGRGKIVGSTVRCGGSVIANEVGSELGVATTLFLGMEQESTDFTQRKRELNALLQKIYSSIGSGDPRTLLINTPPDKRTNIAQVLKLRLGAEKELRDIEESILKERAAMKKAINSKLKVTKTIHPGTVIHSYGTVFKVTTPIEHSKVYYSPDEGKIIVTSM